MERQENSNQEGSTNDPITGLKTMARSASMDTIFYVFNVMSTNFEWITGHISQGGQFMWTIILQACHLMLEVSHQMTMSIVIENRKSNIILDGGENRFHLLKESLKETRKKILNIGQAFRQAFMNYWVNQETLDLNLVLQDVVREFDSLV